MFRPNHRLNDPCGDVESNETSLGFDGIYIYIYNETKRVTSMDSDGNGGFPLVS